MNADPNEEKLQRLFQDLRRQDARQAPAFDRVSRPFVPAQGAAVRFAPWCWRLAAIAVLLLAVGVVFRQVRAKTRSPEAEPQQWAKLSNWRASTDDLLNESTTSWGATITTPTDSWLEDSTATNSTPTHPKETL